jgi:hypothetical protein
LITMIMYDECESAIRHYNINILYSFPNFIPEVLYT